MLSLNNNRKISDISPSNLFQDLKQTLGSKFDEFLASNFINEDAYEACLQNNYTKFIELRKELLINEIKKVTL
ncbi:hypothetical protein [Nostoc sp.]